MDGKEYVQVCSSFSELGECLQREWVLAYLPSTEADLISFYGFNAQAFRLGFGGTLSLFAVGLAVGLVLAIMRKARA